MHNRVNTDTQNIFIFCFNEKKYHIYNGYHFLHAYRLVKLYIFLKLATYNNKIGGITEQKPLFTAPTLSDV